MFRSATETNIWFDAVAAAIKDETATEVQKQLFHDLAYAVSRRPNEKGLREAVKILEEIDKEWNIIQHGYQRELQPFPFWTKSLLRHAAAIIDGELSGRGPSKEFRYKYSDSRRPVSATSSFFSSLGQALRA